MIKDLFRKSLHKIIDDSFSFRVIKKKPSDWSEENIYLTSAESNFAGLFNYDVSPYNREIIDCYSPENPTALFGVLKCSQSGLTTSVVINGICYFISEYPSNIMFLSGNETLVKDTIRDRLDPVIQNSGLGNLIRPSVMKKKNQKSGDTDSKKEFAGGSLTSIAYNPSKLRFYSIKYVFADEFDDAPRNDKKEGSIRALVEARTKSYDSTKKIGYFSTPTIKGQSNIEDVWNDGDKSYWNWHCPHCKNYIPILWRIKKDEGVYAGIKWELDENKELIEESVHYECQECGGKIYDRQRYDLNLKGKFIPTVKPKFPNYRSFKVNALILPPGFVNWIGLVRQWLDACPPDGVIDEGKLKVFINTQLADVWEEKGKTIRVHELMNNTRGYGVGIVPDKTIENDGNGKVVIITLSCDLGGIMDNDLEDVRLDWEVIAHTSGGTTYAIEHGSIGTFERSRHKTKREKQKDLDRELWTYNFGVKNSVWDELRKLIDRTFIGESGDGYNIDLTVIDTGFFTRLAYTFIKSIEHTYVVGVKGYEEGEYRKLSKDTPVISRSRELVGQLYVLQTNQLKDILASNMKLKKGMDGFQPVGFMNFPQPEGGYYTMRSYFSHFEGEHRVPVMKDGVEVGFAWKKKNSHVKNHFFDTSVYTLAAREIYIDILRRIDSKYSKLTWEDFVNIVDGN